MTDEKRRTVPDRRAAATKPELMLLREEIRELRDALPVVLLSQEQQRLLQLAIERWEQKGQLRRAVIEKSLIGLLWMAIIGAGLVVREYAISHGMWKP